ncbi:hypothetical protein [Glaciibacter psychrotolerans]|uniref:Uncharacterized protein n=1 Tax=Glaciibacter psychrotolerans TaxID=670054 RepID=A0A7Z0J6L5_9MICO|nr:hypothetical protein [Leifsonia psychrotolerans]NYJ20647.1 hypothetical protein [Leifsonia psychrotolerans]
MISKPGSAPKVALGRMAMTAGGFALALFLAVTAAGGSYAFLSQQSNAAPATTLGSGTASLTVTTPLSLSVAKLYPGATVVGTATVKNAGDVALALRLNGLTAPAVPNAFSSSLVVGLSVVASAAQCTSATAAVWSGSFAAASTGSLNSTLPVGSSGILCVSVTLPSTAPAASQGQLATGFGILIDGTQV